MTHLTPEQTAAAKEKVYPVSSGFTYWTVDLNAPVYPTRAEAERASIQEWRDNL